MLLMCRADILDMSATDTNVCRLGGVADRNKSQHCQPSPATAPLANPFGWPLTHRIGAIHLIDAVGGAIMSPW